ncbi:MAG: hypothetical protein Q8P45_01620 [Candidatus Harrisonbacteria bacterium]|nr:hypothetical protein [Candidatus Harrisonbacteria bacterium]
MQQNPEFLDQEIAELERKLAAKKEALASQSNPVEERVTFEQVFSAHSGHEKSPDTTEQFSGSSPSQTAAIPSSARKRPLTQEEEEQMKAFIEHSFQKGVISAVSEAKKMNDPYFLDTFHDKLIDEYYQKLIQARQIGS